MRLQQLGQVNNDTTVRKLRTYAVPTAVLASLLLVTYSGVVLGLLQQWWDDPNYSHGFLIPLVSSYLIWSRRRRLLELQAQTSYTGLGVLLFGLVLLVLGTAGAEEFTMRLSLVVVLGGLAYFLLGTAMMKELWFPLAFLLFMIPIPYMIYYSLTFPMQLAATKMSAGALSGLGIPVLRQGNILHLPNYSLEVIEACSGLRSVISLSALGAAFAYLSARTVTRGTLLFVSSIPIAILANVFRLVVTASGALLIGSNFVDGFLHSFSGVVVFLFGLAALFAEKGAIDWFGRAKRTGPRLA